MKRRGSIPQPPQMEDKKAVVSMNKEQTEVFKWFMENYSFFSVAYFKCRPGSFHGHMNSKAEITKPEITIYPKNIDKELEELSTEK